MNIGEQLITFNKNETYVNRYSPILACNKPNGNNDELGMDGINVGDGKPSNNKKDDKRLKVYLRVKKSECFKNLYELDNNFLHCKVPKETQCTKIFKENTFVTNTYTFSKIFGPETNQNVLFDDIVRKKFINFIKGLNSTLLAYGASGSGKTYTVIGTPTEPGIIPRTFEYLFHTLPSLPDQPRFKPLPTGDIKQLNEIESKVERNQISTLLSQNASVIYFKQHNSNYLAMQQQLENEIGNVTKCSNITPLGVWISFAEIYNENIHDLLISKSTADQFQQKLQLGNNNGNAYIKNLKYIYVTSALEAYTVLQVGLHNMNYAETSINHHSSRSHCIFTIKLVQDSTVESGICLSSFNFCDLAGSEPVKKTNNVGNRLKESRYINMSLLVLGKCISLIRDNQQYKNKKLIPFRESKLTLLFQKALLGHEIISLIVNINPIKEMFYESQHVLNFSAIAKAIKVVTEQTICKRKSTFLEHLQKKSDISVICEESTVDLKSELLMQVELLQNEIVQNAANHKTDCEELIALYKKNEDDTIKNWEKTYEKLKNHLISRLEENRKLDKTAENDELKKTTSRKRKISIINLDNSTDEDELPNQNTKTSKQKRKEILQKELLDLQQKFQANEAQNAQDRRKVSELKEVLKQAEKDYTDLLFYFQNKQNLKNDSATETNGNRAKI